MTTVPLAAGPRSPSFNWGRAEPDEILRRLFMSACQEETKMSIAKIGLALSVLSAVVIASAVPSYAREPGLRISVARAAAIRGCNVAAAKYPEYVWGNVKLYIYRSCMVTRGQQE